MTDKTLSPAGIPDDLAYKAARHWFGAASKVERDKTKTVYSSDGGSYTLEGVRISSLDWDESAIIYLNADNAYCIEFFDGGCGRITENPDGTFVYKGYGDPQTFGTTTN